MDKSSDGQYASDEDIFDDEEDRRKSWSFDGSAVLASLEKECEGDRERLARARRILAGVPPPPNCTNPQVCLDDALARLRSPAHSLESLLKIQRTVGNEIIAGHDVYLNRNNYIEELEVIRPELEKWFVSNETSSLLTTVPQRPTTASAKKRSRANGWSASPNSRVNYLHRRKATFSALHTSSAPRTLTIDKGKLANKTKLESKTKETKSSLKRALFQSPEKQPHRNNGISSADCSVPSGSSGSVSQTPTRSQRMSWRRNETKLNSQEKSSEKKKCWRSLPFNEGEQKEKISLSKVSNIHHKKLLWAVDHLLRSEGVKSSDAEFRQLCCLLYRETAAVWLRDHENRSRPAGTSTSALMVNLARSFLRVVERKAGVTISDIRARRGPSDLDTSRNLDSTCPASLTSSLDSSVLSMKVASVESESSSRMDSIFASENVETTSIDSYRMNSETLSEASYPPPTPPPRKAKNTPKKGRTPSKRTPAKKSPIKTPAKTPTKTPIKTPIKSLPSTTAGTPSKLTKKTLQRSCKRVISPSGTQSPENISTEESVSQRYPKRKRKEVLEENSKKLKYIEEVDETSAVSTPISKSSGCDEETTDKENNSAIKNADLDAQNWSPVIRFKRMARNRWSSELKKKRVSSSSSSVKNIEDSPNCPPPFLGLEGPFKYRSAEEGALKRGEYIRVVLSGNSYIRASNRLIKNNEITASCILVRASNTGLELLIPVILLYQHQNNLGKHDICDVVEDVLEDAICRLEELEIRTDQMVNGFPGFTVDDFLNASWKVHRMNRAINLLQVTGSPCPRPLFSCYKYALVATPPPDSCHYYQLAVEIPKLSAFIIKREVDENTILVRPCKSESPKRIILELSIPVTLFSSNNPPSFIKILQDLDSSQKI